MVNSDLHPVSYLYSLQIWLSYFPGLANIPIQAILAVKLRNIILWLFALAAIFKTVSLRIKAVKDASIPAVVTLIGFTAMLLQLLTIYSFEALYGYIYYMIGILIAVFMGGLAAGSYISNNKLKQIRMDQAIALLFLSIAAFALYLHSTPELDLELSKYLISIFSFSFAALVGVFFPAAVRDYRSRNLENMAGVLYGCDLLGGAFSAVLTSLLFMPVFGIIGTISIPLCLCLISLVLLFQSSS
jgi:spermidine synthase